MFAMFKKLLTPCVTTGAACLAVFALTGCRSGSSSDVNTHSSFQFPGETQPSGKAPVLVASNQPLAPEAPAPSPANVTTPAPANFHGNSWSVCL